MENKTLMIDTYEFTMAQTYFDNGRKDEIVYFDIFFRNNPFEGGYTISGGLEETIKYIENFKFEDVKTKSDILATCLYEAARYNNKSKKLRADFTDGDPDKEAHLYVLKHTECPAVLTENFF